MRSHESIYQKVQWKKQKSRIWAQTFSIVLSFFMQLGFALCLDLVLAKKKVHFISEQQSFLLKTWCPESLKCFQAFIRNFCTSSECQRRCKGVLFTGLKRFCLGETLQTFGNLFFILILIFFLFSVFNG